MIEQLRKELVSTKRERGSTESPLVANLRHNSFSDSYNS